VRAALATIRTLIDVDQVVLVVPARKAGQYAVSVHATDGGARLAGVTVKVGDRDLETAFAAAASKLYEKVASAPVATRTRPRPRRPVEEHRRRPQLYKRWWFWAGVGAGAVTILAISMLASDDGPPGCPSGDSCGTVVFRF
jgi:hypothetical protein